MLQPPPDEPLPAPELLLVIALLELVPGLRTAPELEAPLLLLALLPVKPVPFQSGASPLDAATASPRKPITVASQFWSLPLFEIAAMLELTEPSVLPELDDNPSVPLPPELPKLDEPWNRLEPLELLELLELLDLAEVPELALEPVRCTRTIISSTPGIEGTATMSWRQCQSPLPKALMSPSLLPAVGA
jgi:hypothetical protein